MGFPGGSVVKNPPANAGDIRDMGLIPGLGRSPGGGHGNPLQCSCWRIPWTEEPGGLQSMELQSWTQLITQTHTHRFQENTYSGNGLSGHLVETMGSPGSLYLASRSYTHWGNLLVIWLVRLNCKNACLARMGGSLGENGYMYTYGWVPSLFIWDLSQHCLLIGYQIRSDQLLSCVRLFATMNRSMPGLPVPGLIFRIIGYNPIKNKTFRKKIA